MIRASLVQRLTVLQLWLAAALTVSFIGLSLWISSHTLERQESTFLTNTAVRLARSFEQEFEEEHDLTRAARAVLFEDAPLGIRADIYDARGGLLASTGRGARPGHDTREVREHAAPGAWIVTSMSTRPRRDALRALGLALLTAGLPLWLAVSLLGYWLAHRALQPLSRMASQAERIPTGRDAISLGTPGDPREVAVLAASFDGLIERLDELVRAEQHFSEDAAHELRTPLTVLSGELEYALGDPGLAFRHRAGLERAAGQVRAMSDLVEALLFLRLADGGASGRDAERAPVNLADLARDSVRELLLQYPERSADVSVEADDETLVAGHAVLLASGLRNLISNAFKFTDRSQPVRVAVRSTETVGSVVVEDGGSGIADEDRAKVFDAFYRSPEARASKEGFGLGLPILRRVARAHGGDVVLSASELGGARFEMSLPRWTPAP